MIWQLLVLSLGMSACSATQTKRRVDGSYAINCSSQKACLDRAEKICGEPGYAVVGGRHDEKIYGVPGNQKVVGKNELYVRCNKDKIADAPDPAVGSWKLERSDAGTASKNTQKEKGLVCRPGETQRCIGAGACVGGQACEADGSRFGPCDCGEPARGTRNLTESADGGLQ
jgi:hypothetical protein